MKKVIHLIPFDGIGGVEAAVISMRDAVTPTFDFKVRVLFPTKPGRLIWLRSFNPIIFIISALNNLAEKPQLLIVSLWRASIVGILCKLLSPNLKLVVFLHAEKSVHIVDKWINRFAIALADEIWADSNATIHAMVPKRRRHSTYVVSYVPRRFAPVEHGPIAPNFVYWGRLAKQKNLTRALKIFAAVRRKCSVGKFVVIGPDGGEGAKLAAAANALGIADDVHFEGPVDQDELPKFAKDASFFLMTSEYEGMGLAVVEAMQMGLVPVVTPVGAIGDYCRANVNAIVIVQDSEAIDTIAAAIENHSLYKKLKVGALVTWAESESYQDSVIMGCSRLLGDH